MLKVQGSNQQRLPLLMRALLKRPCAKKEETVLPKASIHIHHLRVTKHIGTAASASASGHHSAWQRPPAADRKLIHCRSLITGVQSNEHNLIPQFLGNFADRRQRNGMIIILDLHFAHHLRRDTICGIFIFHRSQRTDAANGHYPMRYIWWTAAIDSNEHIQITIYREFAETFTQKKCTEMI